MIFFLVSLQLFDLFLQIYMLSDLLLMVSYFSMYAFYSCRNLYSAFFLLFSFSCKNWQKAVSLLCNYLSFCLRSSSPDLNSDYWLHIKTSTFWINLSWIRIVHESSTFFFFSQEAWWQERQFHIDWRSVLFRLFSWSYIFIRAINKNCKS